MNSQSDIATSSEILLTNHHQSDDIEIVLSLRMKHSLQTTQRVRMPKKEYPTPNCSGRGPTIQQTDPANSFQQMISPQKTVEFSSPFSDLRPTSPPFLVGDDAYVCTFFYSQKFFFNQQLFNESPYFCNDVLLILQQTQRRGYQVPMCFPSKRLKESHSPVSHILR